MKYEKPNYKRIYMDIIMMKFPESKEKYKSFFKKKELSEIDVIRLNNLLFNQKNETEISINGKHRSYKKSTIIEILDYQKKNNLNNTETAKQYGLSRNTIAKWKKIFLV